MLFNHWLLLFYVSSNRKMPKGDERIQRPAYGFEFPAEGRNGIFMHSVLSKIGKSTKKPSLRWPYGRMSSKAKAIKLDIDSFFRRLASGNHDSATLFGNSDFVVASHRKALKSRDFKAFSLFFKRNSSDVESKSAQKSAHIGEQEPKKH